MSNVTTEQVTAAQKKAIAQMLEVIDDPTTIHKAWSILNRYSASKEREAKKGGAKA